MDLTPEYAGGRPVVVDDVRMHLRHRVSWGAVFAGVAAALVVQLLLNMLGIGIGASSLDATQLAANPSVSSISTTAGIWWLASGIIASLAGGIAAGRLSGSADRNTARWHGLVSWCVATLVIVMLLTSAIGGILGGTINALGSTLGAAGRGAASAVSTAAQNTNGDALQGQVQRLVNPDDAQSVRDDVMAYVRASLNGDHAAADAARERAVNGLARTANISPDEARSRLDKFEQQAQQTANQVKQKAQAAAEAARRGAAIAGIFGFVALAFGAVAAWFGGGVGMARGRPVMGTPAPGQV